MRPILSRFPAALAILLWFGATFYFLGDTGRHSDDYHAHVRNFATGALEWSRQPWARWPYFWRPLHLAHVHTVGTIFYDHPAIGHLELALVHGAVGWMLAGLLTRLGIRSSVSFTIALLFVTLPLVAEAALWTSASCNAISCLFLLRALELVRRQAVGPVTRLRTLWIGLLTFATACWYEPAAAGMAAAPFIYLAASPVDTRFRDRARGLLSLLLAAAIPCLTYVALLLLTAPPGARGATGSLVTSDNALTRFMQIARHAAYSIYGPRAQSVITGGIEQGWGILRHPPGSMLIAAAIVLAIGAVIVFTARAARINPTDRTDNTLRTSVLLVLGGLAFFLGGFIPLLIVNRNGVELRTLYVPLLGAAVFFAALAGIVADRIGRTPTGVHAPVAALAATIILSAAVLGMIGMVGFQAQLRQNSLNDRLICANLRALVPNPEPGTMFLPLRLKVRGAATSRPIYNRALHTGLEAPWCSSPLVRREYRRSDISCTCVPYWANGRLPFSSLDAEGLASSGLILGAEIGNDGLARVRWDRCIPFVVAPDCSVRLVPRVTLKTVSGQTIELHFPRTPIVHDGRPALVASILEAPGNVRVRIRSEKSTAAPNPPDDSDDALPTRSDP